MSDPYKGLDEKLHSLRWPNLYMFKFIVPNDNHKLAQCEALFGPDAQVSINKSRTGKYLSITGKEVMTSAEEVMKKYRKSSEIEGLIAL